MLAFGDWIPLTASGLDEVPDAPGALQVGRADRSLVDYPKGKSAMVFYVYAARSMREGLRRLFADELEEPGVRGQGTLVVRCCPGGDEAQSHLAGLYDEFSVRFGRAPILNIDDDDDDDDE